MTNILFHIKYKLVQPKNILVQTKCTHYIPWQAQVRRVNGLVLSVLAISESLTRTGTGKTIVFYA